MTEIRLLTKEQNNEIQHDVFRNPNKITDIGLININQKEEKETFEMERLLKDQKLEIKIDDKETKSKLLKDQKPEVKIDDKETKSKMDATKKDILKFFGIVDESDALEEKKKWQSRKKLLYPKLAKIMDEKFADIGEDTIDSFGQSGVQSVVIGITQSGIQRKPPQYYTQKDNILAMFIRKAKPEKDSVTLKSKSFASADLAFNKERIYSELDDDFFKLSSSIDENLINDMQPTNIKSDFNFQKDVTDGNIFSIQSSKSRIYSELDDDQFKLSSLIDENLINDMQPTNINSDFNFQKDVTDGKIFSIQSSKSSKKSKNDAIGKNNKEDKEMIFIEFPDQVNRKPNKVQKLGFLDKYVFNTPQKLEKEIEEAKRPYFTYWVTFVQVVCFIIALCVYGIAPIGFEETVVEAEVLSVGLFIESVSYMEKDNFWIGPRQTDLIHLGAKYSPCMRLDTNIENAIKSDRAHENATACCIRNDGSGCVQTPYKACASILSTWLKWNGPERYSGSVCGQDPTYCKAPASVTPFEWPDSIIDWPICTEKIDVLEGGASHMTCNMAGRPCCHGIQGECLITTPEHCEFLRGYFHDEANLCAQVSCMQQTCGMLPFWNPNRPNQFYRLWTSLFIHAGLLQLVISILFQILIMSDEEKVIGCIRMSIIYLSSGVCGSLASAIFTPYNVEAGPSGSQFGILACILISRIDDWQDFTVSSKAIIFITIIFLFIIGWLPMVDNYAHIFGFIFGGFITFAIHPGVWFNIKSNKSKIVAVSLCILGVIVTFFLLIFFFYVMPIYNCKYCQYFSCIPFTPNFCKSMEISVRREGEL